jgi:hypothetical protein
MRIHDLLTEDEYDQFDQEKNPNLLKVNADTFYKTSKADQIFWKPEDFKLWEDRAAKLRVRVQRIYARLQTVMPQEDKVALNGVKVLVPLTGDSGWASARYDDKTISVDLGCFWDLSDDCLAYTLGHEIGHMVWAHGPKKNWAREKQKSGLGRRPAPENRQLEKDADIYGALLAYQLGYDRRKAWENFTVAYQREPWDPKNPEYPSIPDRKANVDRAIAQDKKRRQQASPANEPAVEPMPTTPEVPAGPSPDKAQKDAWLRHIMNGMQKFEVALAQDPNMRLA